MTQNKNHETKKELVEGVDYYFNDKGLMVFTKQYHLNRGYCCKSGCLHCPYGYVKGAEEQKIKAKVGE